MSMVDLVSEFFDQFLEGRRQRVVNAVCKDVGSRSDQMCGDPEGRTGLGASFDQNAGFVDLQGFPERFEALIDQRSEGC